LWWSRYVTGRREEVTGRGRELCNEMRWTRNVACTREDKTIDFLEDVDMNWRILLIWMSKKYNEDLWDGYM
jgi:hypothetical protein